MSSATRVLYRSPREPRTEPSTVTFLEKREPLSSIDSTAPLSMSERPFIKVPLKAASLRSACTNVPCAITSSNLTRGSLDNRHAALVADDGLCLCQQRNRACVDLGWHLGT